MSEYPQYIEQIVECFLLLSIGSTIFAAYDSSPLDVNSVYFCKATNGEGSSSGSGQGSGQGSGSSSGSGSGSGQGSGSENEPDTSHMNSNERFNARYNWARAVTTEQQQIHNDTIRERLRGMGIEEDMIDSVLNNKNIQEAALHVLSVKNTHIMTVRDFVNDWRHGRWDNNPLSDNNDNNMDNNKDSKK